MNLSFLTTLNAVIKHGSFARAAIEVHVSPSTVSLQMKRLEEYYGQPWFDRSATTIKPTALAYEVAGLMSNALDQMESLRRRGSSVIEGCIALGAIESMQTHILPDALRYLCQRTPNLSGSFDFDISTCVVHVRFEKGNIYEYNLQMNDGSVTMGFIDDKDHFLKHLRKSFKFMIEAPVFTYGRKQFKFSVAKYVELGTV